MKIFLTIILSFIVLKGFSQTNELTEEKSSDWIRITSSISSVARPKATTTPKKKTTNKKPVAPAENTQQEFEKTNQKVNRFKKTKNN